MLIKIFQTAAAAAILLCGVSVYASEKEEVIAPWENAAEGKIWSRMVISETYSNSGNKTPLNALCDKTAFETVKSLRKKAVLKLHNDIKNGASSYSTQLYAAILKNISETDTGPLQQNELELLSSVELSAFSFPLKNLLSNGQGSKPELADILYLSAASNTNISCSRIKLKKTAIQNIQGVLNISKNVNLNDYSFKSEKTDNYNLYLYIWENNPFKCRNLYNLPLSFSTALSFGKTANSKTEPIPFSKSNYPVKTCFFKGVVLC